MALVHLLDTSAYSVFTEGRSSALETWMTTEKQLVLSVITVGELRAGYAAGNRRQANEEILQRFLDSPNVSVAYLSDTTTTVFAEMFAEMRKSGRTVGSNDLWIAATAREHGYAVVTLDSDFERIPGIEVVMF